MKFKAPEGNVGGIAVRGVAYPLNADGTVDCDDETHFDDMLSHSFVQAKDEPAAPTAPATGGDTGSATGDAPPAGDAKTTKGKK